MVETSKGLILVVEDSIATATLERHCLERAGYKVITALTTDAAHTSIAQGGVDLIVLDYMLPGGVTGLEFLAQIKAKGHDLPVIMVTGMSDESTVIAALRAGVHDFVIKSVELIDLLPQAVEHLFVQINTRKKLAESEVRLHESQQQRIEELSAINAEMQIINHKLEDAQNNLLQAEKMASIGQLAAGVAHEINNPIGYVYSNLSTLEKYVQDVFGMLNSYEQAEGAIADSAVRTRLQAAREKLDLTFLKEDLSALMAESKDGIICVKNIVQNLQDFSHIDANAEWRYANLHAGIDSALNIVNNEIKYKANLIKEYGDLPEVECLASQLNQVFMNLLINAAHAIEEYGTITVRTGHEGEEVWVDIADSGKGIPPDNLKKIFDPFFTTKPIGQGTGLGLSLSYGIIQKHRGRIEVSSEVGKGTAFRVWLPVRQPQDKEQERGATKSVIPEIDTAVPRSDHA